MTCLFFCNIFVTYYIKIKMKNSEILLVDDDDNHLFILKEKLTSLGYKNLIMKSTFHDALEYINFNVPDLVIIDYYLDKRRTALDFIKQSDVFKIPPTIIVSTFFDESILEQLKFFNVSDFISKSCSTFELSKSITLSISKKHNYEKKEPISHFIFVKVGNIARKINLVDVEMFEVDGKYLKIHVQGRDYLIRSTLNDLVKRLPCNFVKVHQSFIVNLDFIEHINLIDHKVKLKNVEVVFSKNYKKTILNSSYLK